VNEGKTLLPISKRRLGVKRWRKGRLGVEKEVNEKGGRLAVSKRRLGVRRR
jgi:hypothetical protein